MRARISVVAGALKGFRNASNSRDAGCLLAGTRLANQGNAFADSSERTESGERADVAIIAFLTGSRGEQATRRVTGVLGTRVAVLATHRSSEANAVDALIADRAKFSVVTQTDPRFEHTFPAERGTGVDGTGISIVTALLVSDTRIPQTGVPDGACISVVARQPVQIGKDAPTREGIARANGARVTIFANNRNSGAGPAGAGILLRAGVVVVACSLSGGEGTFSVRATVDRTRIIVVAKNARNPDAHPIQTQAGFCTNFSIITGNIFALNRARVARTGIGITGFGCAGISIVFTDHFRTGNGSTGGTGE